MKTMNNTTLAEALFALAAALVAQPAETVTQAVVSVAKTGQRKIARAVRQKVSAQRVHNGGTIPTGIPCWKLIDDGIIDDKGNPIADAMAPTASTTVTVAKATPTDKQLMRMRKADLVALLQAQDA